MHAETQLLSTLAVGLIAAFAGGYVARRIGLPPIVGYLVAGVLIGPFTPGFVADRAVATELAEIGVILLMFGVGLHFSLKDLWGVSSIAVPGAAVQIAFATALGVAVGLALGWPIAGGVVLGLALSVASTVVLLRALGERRDLDTLQGRIAVGWLIVQDLFTILVLLLLPTVAALMVDGTTLGRAALDVAIALIKAGILIAVMAFFGARWLPRLLLSVARDGSRELFTLAVLATSIGIAWLSYTVFGVSLALGAFLAGAVLAESDLSHRAASDALPLRDAFAVLFFVSVGMLVDPLALVAMPLEVAAVLALVMVGNPLAALAIVTVAGYQARIGLTVAAGLAQVGEFTFIMAGLSLSLGLLPEEGFQLAVAAALLSISLNPLVFRVADRVEPRLRTSAAMIGLRRRRQGGLDRLPEAVPRTPGKRHAVIIGHGRVGSAIAGALGRRGFGYIVIEQDRRLVERLRARGVSVIYGDAIDPDLLEHARLGEAAVLLIAVADPAVGAIVLQRAREMAPQLDVVVRTHAEKTASRLRTERGVWPVVGERELAIQMARVALRRFGVSGAEVEAVAQGIRSGPPDPPMRGSRPKPIRRPAWLTRLTDRRARVRPSAPPSAEVEDVAPDSPADAPTPLASGANDPALRVD